MRGTPTRLGLGGWWLLFVLASGCGGSVQPHPRQGHAGAIVVATTFRGDYPIQVVATTGMVADLVRNVGGSRVAVTQLMNAGVDPHLYKPSSGDISLLKRADLIFYSGRNLEGKMGDVLVRMARTKPTFAVTEYIEDHYVLEDEDNHYDPHLWFDVSLWSKAAAVVRDVLAQFDPHNAGAYRQQADAYQARLQQLHVWCKEQIATIPKERRVLVTAHDAFRYFGRAYAIEVRGIQGISTDAEAGIKEINELVQFLADRRIKAIFVESSVSEKNVQAVIEGCWRGRKHKVHVGGELFSDAMGPPGTPAGTYEGMMRHNVETIVKALQ